MKTEMPIKRINVSELSRRDFEFFRSTELDLIGNQVGVLAPTVHESGYSAVECWHLKDSQGKDVPCREPAVLSKAIRSKQSWNLQVKMWAEDIAGDMLVLQQQELHEMCRGLPSWIFEATMRQAERLISARLGFAPRFSRLEKLHGNWWPPEMDRFDAMI